MLINITQLPAHAKARKNAMSPMLIEILITMLGSLIKILINASYIIAVALFPQVLHLPVLLSLTVKFLMVLEHV